MFLKLLIWTSIFGQEPCIKKSISYGHSLGDSISKDFEVSKDFGPYFSEVTYLNDTTLRAFTICDHISSFRLELTKTRFNKTIDTFKKQIGKPNLHYVGDTLNGVQLNHEIEYYLWVDSLSYTKYSAYINLESMTKGTLRIINDTISESLKWKYIEGYEESLKPIEFDTTIVAQ